MANALYDKARERFLRGQLDWLTDTIKVVLVDTGNYSVNLAAHEFLSDIPSAARVAISGALTGKTATGGVADADDVTIAAVSGPTVEALVIFKDTGNPSTSPLIAWIDTASGLPFTPNGGDVTIQWDNGANRIFKL